MIAGIILFNCLLLLTGIFNQYLYAQPVKQQERLLKLVGGLDDIANQFQSLGKLSNKALKALGLKEAYILDDKIKVEIAFDSREAASSFDYLKFGIEKDYCFYVYSNVMQALVPAKSLRSLNSDPSINYIRIPIAPQPDEIISSGLRNVRANFLRAYNYTGKGVKVAVLDVGFEGYERLLGNELPSSVTVKSYYNNIYGGGDIEAGKVHGTAVAEIVHDVAPDAQLYLINYNSETELKLAIDYCITNGVRIINHSVTRLYGTFDGSGSYNALFENAVTSGILMINSAGNYKKSHFQGEYFDADDSGWMNFSAGSKTLAFKAHKGDTVKIYMSWKDWTQKSSDYDLYLYAKSADTLKLVDRSMDRQNGLIDPVETIICEIDSTNTYYISVNKVWGIAKPIEIFVRNEEVQFVDFNHSYASSVTDPVSVDKVLSVGAYNYLSEEIEPFSSLGPTNDGRIKPDVMGPDAVENSTVGSFSGTSASAPHIAGAAALLLEENPALTVAELRNLITQYAEQAGSPDKNNTTGYGYVRLRLSKKPQLNGWLEVPSAGIFLSPENSYTRHASLSYSDVAFANDSVGWVVGKYGLILKTIDGGYTWNQQTSKSIIDLKSIFILSGDSVYVVGNSGRVIFTLNGGISWQNESIETNADFKDVFFSKNLTGYIAGTNGEVYKKDNFTSVASIQNVPAINYEAIYGRKEASVWFVGNNGKCVYTDDGGQSYNSISFPDQINLIDIQFVTEHNGYILKARRDVCYTNDGGLKWRTVAVDTSQLCAMYFINASYGFIMSKTGKLFQTVNGGLNWKPVQDFSDYSLYTMFFLNRRNGLVAGQNGRMYLFKSIGVPMDLVNFSCSITKKPYVVITWTAAPGAKESAMTIERQKENSKWQNIGFVPARSGVNVYQYEDTLRAGGKYSYRIKQIDVDSSYEYSDTASVVFDMPDDFTLSNPYPNPFNGATSVEFNMPFSAKINVAVFNVLGQRVKTLENKYLNEGYYKYVWDGKSDANIQVATGIYFIVANLRNNMITKKILYLK